MSIAITKTQKDYIFAKAWKKTLESTLDDFEKEYIIAHNIKNSNGSTPAHFYAWDAEDKTADKAVEDFYSDPDIKQLCSLKKEANELFDKAEDALIDFATVLGVDDAGSIMVKWDNGCSLSVVYGADRCHRIKEE